MWILHPADRGPGEKPEHIEDALRDVAPAPGPTEDREAICRRCGECCRLKIITPKGERVILDMWCPALDPRTKLCRIYDRRRELMPELVGLPCLTVPEAMRRAELPKGCPYTGEHYVAQVYEPERLAMVPRRIYLKVWAANMRMRMEIGEWIRKHRSPLGPAIHAAESSPP